MTSPSTRILLVGNEFRLLSDRLSALAAAGAQAVISNPAELETHVGCEPFHVVVLCHTMSDLERRAVTESVHRRWPRIKVLQVLGSEADFRSFGCVLNDHTTDDPQTIARHAMALLAA
jgi:hypothetical protein